MDLIATAGSATANSYCTVAEGTLFHESRLHNTNWTGATTANQKIALIWATRLIDEQMEWTCLVTNDDQALGWPQQGAYYKTGEEIDEDIIPDFLKNATAEYAMFLLAEDRTTDSDSKGIKKFKDDVLEFEFDKYDAKTIMPVSVWSMLKFYGSRAGSRGVRVLSRG